VELGAVVVIPQTLSVESCSPVSGKKLASTTQPLPLWPVVGRNLVQEWINRIQRVGVEVLSIAQSSQSNAAKQTLKLARDGVEQFLVVSLRSYAEIDLLDFLRYHRERRSTATEAINQDGPLGVEILSRTSMTFNQAANWEDSADHLHTSQYRFHGYAKHLSNARGYSDLVADALSRQCALTPRGSQFGPATWVSENANIDPSVQLNGPCFVGRDTMLHEGVTLGPFTSIEDGCVVECGTMIEGSTILPQTYVAAGLSIRRSVVDGPQLEQLDSGIKADLACAGLTRRLPRRSKTRIGNDGEDRGGLRETQTSSMETAQNTRIGVAARTAMFARGFVSAT
jgi:carbonic anhydrase/acetyltransferase-like protein (isoleucine patch superfamily)